MQTNAFPRHQSGIVILGACLSFTAFSAFGNTFTVTNTNDTGAGSLRQAIADANGNAGLDTIAFNIPGSGVHTITPVTQLPFITSPVVLDGYTQPGASANTLANGDNAVLLIEINGAILTNNGVALLLQTGASGSTIRGLVIDNGWDSAVLTDTDTVTVEGCFLGTDPTGAIARGNTHGVRMESGQPTSGMRIGGTSPAARNVISGNSTGVSIFSGANQLVQGNFIGTDATGTTALANGSAVDLRTDDNLIGGTTAAARNIIAGIGNSGGFGGIEVRSGARNRIQGNFIGTDVTGTKPLGFGFFGAVLLDGGSATQVGGLTAAPGTPPGNVIAGSLYGIFIQGVSNNTILGNLIGTDATGNKALGNSLDGINIQGASNVIGGLDVMARNVISANGRHGISLGNDNVSVRDNSVQGNFIGTDLSGTQLLGNGGDGVFVIDSINNTIGGEGVVITDSINHTIGGVVPAGAPGNLIAGNGGRGVGVAFGAFGVTGLAIKGNSIFSNGGLGIDLSRDGVTLNDAGDADTGVNNLQNYPVLTSASSSGGNTAIAGTLNSAANTTYRIEFFANNAVDPTGYGEGQSFAGSTNVTTDANGNASFNVNVPQIAGIQHVTATATDPNGNSSEFSGAIGQLLNISTRLRVQTGDNVLIGGFIIAGSDPKRVIVRGIGPSLASVGVQDFLADPTLELHDATSTLATNDNWKTRPDGSSQQAEIEATTIPPSDDLEAAIVRTLPANNASYTAIVRGKNNTTGIGVVEAYDLDQAANSKLANISTRGLVEAGDNVLIGGFIAGNGLTKVIIRAIGPTLTNAGVTNPLQDPTLELHDGSGTTISSNDNWKLRPDGSSQQAEIEATTIPPTNDFESAIVSTLPPGNYTAVERGKSDTTGIAVVEVYNLQ
jgi:hypothetical protein